MIARGTEREIVPVADSEAAAPLLFPDLRREGRRDLLERLLERADQCTCYAIVDPTMATAQDYVVTSLIYIAPAGH